MAVRHYRNGAPNGRRRFAVASVLALLALGLATPGCARPKAEGSGAKPVNVTVRLVCNDRGWIEYRLGSGKALKTVEELGREVAALGKRSQPVLLVVDARDSNALSEELSAVREACEAAGGVVLEMPLASERAEALTARAGSRVFNLPVQAVGTRDGALQFLVGDRLMEGDEDALTGALGKAIKEFVARQDGFTLIRVFWRHAPELGLDGDRLRELSLAIDAAAPRLIIVNEMRDWRTEPVESPLAREVVVQVAGPFRSGNRYLHRDRVVDGEEALWGELQRELAGVREGRDNPRACVLRLTFVAEIRKGVTATEEQLAVVRRTFPRDFAGGPFPAAAAPAPAPAEVAAQASGAAAVEVKLVPNRQGRLEYRLDSGKVLASDGELGREVAVLRKLHRVVLVVLGFHHGLVFPEEVAAARSACEAAGGVVAATPPVVADAGTVKARAAGREARMEVKPVGTREGALQIRVDGKLVEGGPETLTAAVRARIAEIEAEEGGFTRIYPAWFPVPELEIDAALTQACKGAIGAAGWQLRSGWWAGTGGSESSFILKRVWIDILAPFKSGSRYALDGRALDGEEALWKALEKELAGFRAEKKNPGDHALDLQFRARVKPGVTATEEQLELVRRTFGSVFDGEPKHLYVHVRAEGVRDGVVQYRVGGDQVLLEGEKALAEYFRPLAARLKPGPGGMPQVRPVLWSTPELDFGERDPELAVRKAAQAAQPGSPEIPPQRKWPRETSEADPLARSVAVTILGPHGPGSRYSCEGRTFDGEEALRAGLAALLEAHRAGKDEPGRYTLRVDIRVEVKPGVTATREQIELARKTVEDSGVTEPGEK